MQIIHLIDVIYIDYMFGIPNMIMLGYIGLNVISELNSWCVFLTRVLET